MNTQRINQRLVSGLVMLGLMGSCVAGFGATSNSDEKPATDPGWTYVPPAPNTLAGRGLALNAVPADSSTSAVPRLQFVLRWNSYPYDLDSHLLTPPINNYSYHIYYSSRGSANSTPFAWLDQDITSGYGPETMTIEQSYPGA